MTEINNTLLVDQAYMAIKEDVLHKRLIPGKKINVKSISQRYSISVTPIKLALNRLVSEGMVESIPHRGMIVKPISLNNLKETLEIRKMIELYCVPSILQHAKTQPEFLPLLEQNLQDHKAFIQSADDNDYYQDQNLADSQFHTLLVATAENERLNAIYESLGAHLTMFYLYGLKNTARFKECLQEHQAIYQAIANQQTDKLQAAICTHLDNVYSNYASNLTSVVNNCENTPYAFLQEQP